MKENKPYEDVILQGDCLAVLKTLPDEFVNCVMTSPPYYGLRDYGVEGQLGLEKTPEEFISKLCDIFDEVKRVLKPEGSCFVNLGDTYGNSQPAGNKVFGNHEFNKNRPSRALTLTPARTSVSPKCLVGIPARFQLEMVKRGWILRNDIIWFKANCMPSSVKDRFTIDYEHLFFFTKNTKYYFKQQLEPLAESSIIRAKYGFNCDRANNCAGVNVSAEEFATRFVKMPPIGGKKKAGGDNPTYSGNTPPFPTDGRNKRCVWKIPTARFSKAHFATFPPALCESPLDAGCPIGGLVLDPFFGAGTVGVVAIKQGKHYLGIELNKEYIEIAEERLADVEEPETTIPQGISVSEENW